MGRQFQGRDIVKTTINLGIAGQIERVDPLPALSLVSFSARGKVSSVKHKFRDDGAVEESTVLTIDPDSFVVANVETAPEQTTLPLTDGAPPDEGEMEPVETEGTEIPA